MAAPHARGNTPILGEDRTLDPLAIQKAYDQGLQAARQSVWQTVQPGVAHAKPAPPPVYSQDVRERGGEKLYSGDRLPQSSGVKAEYANSGKWIERPGS